MIGFILGFLLYFIICRVADKISKDAGDEACYDCDKCTAHCAGYHCHLSKKHIDDEVTVYIPAAEELNE